MYVLYKLMCRAAAGGLQHALGHAGELPQLGALSLAPFMPHESCMAPTDAQTYSQALRRPCTPAVLEPCLVPKDLSCCLALADHSGSVLTTGLSGLSPMQKTASCLSSAALHSFTRCMICAAVCVHCPNLHR